MLDKLPLQSNKLATVNWRTLFVLDACRWDYFAQVTESISFPGDKEPINSEVSNTLAWYKKYWDQQNDDTVLITAHPVPEMFKRRFCKTVITACEVDPDYSWCYPEPTIRVAIREMEKMPTKKFLVHLIPPHLPFIAGHGKKWQNECRNRWTKRADSTKDIYGEATQYGKNYNWETLVRYYKENIMLAIYKIEKYFSDYIYPVVITSDHGEMIGEHYRKKNGLSCGRRYGHIGNHPILKIVPWVYIV